MRHAKFWLPTIILAAFTLRLNLLGEQSLWYDEGVSWMLSQMNLTDLIQWTAADIQPPLSYLILWSTDIIIGDSEWALRFPSVVFSVLTVPLLYALARQLFGSRRPAPLLAAGLAAFSPLMVYYSQEARMYTLLTLLATLASLLLLKLLQTPHPTVWRPRHTALLYLLAAAAALYTHYFAAFLLMAHALYALFVWRQQRFDRRLFVQLAYSFGGTLLLFLPWLPVLLARLGDDPSYWPGALKLDEAIRKVIISFTLGETVFEHIGWGLALGFLAILTTGAATATIRERRITIRRRHLFLGLWLLLPISLILLLSHQSPKFNPRYTLIAWPAFALLLAAALDSLLRPAPDGWPARLALWGLRLTCFGFIAATFAYSLTNWFADPRFSKDDFQALAQFVRERKAPDETVLLSSGHLFPVWAYYYGWDGWTPLPWMLRLDVNRVTTLDIAEEIAGAVEGQGGVWLVTWQDEVIDPTGVVPFWLDVIGERPVDAGDFWGVGLEHWRLDPNDVHLLRETPITHDMAVNFNNQIKLVGMTQLSDSELAFFWQPLASLPDNLILSLDLTDQRGFGWDRETTVSRPGPYLYPPSRWPVGDIVLTRHSLPWQIGAPPGLYIAQIELGTAPEETGQFTSWDVLDEQGRPHRRTALVDYVNLSQLIEPESGPLPQDRAPIIDLFPIIGLRRSILPQPSAQPGDRAPLALLWQAGEYNLDDVSLAFDLVDAAGQTWRVGSSLTPSRRFNLPRWQHGDVVLGQYWLNIPPEAAPGLARLQVHIVNLGAYAYDEVFPINEIEILPTERNFSPPDSFDMPLNADFSGQATLLGADCSQACRAAPGQSVTLTLYWRADAPFDTSYTVFTHALDAAETVRLNADHAPPQSTLGWVLSQIIRDPVTLTVPPDLPPGDYPLEVGLYDAADPAFARLPLANGNTRLILPNPLRVE